MCTGKKSSHPEILVICSFDLLPLTRGVSFQLLTTGIFYLLCFPPWKICLEMLPFTSLPWLSILLSLLLLFKKCPHFITLCTHLANHWHEHSTVLGLGWSEMGLATRAGPIGNAWKGTTLEDQMWGWLARLWKFLSSLRFEWFYEILYMEDGNAYIFIESFYLIWN